MNYLACVLLLAQLVSPRAAHAGAAVCEAEGSGACEAEFKGEWYGEFFPGIPKIRYEGPKSRNPLSFRYYNATEVVYGKPMKDWLRFSVAFWHTFKGDGSDMFGDPTKTWPWADAKYTPMEQAYRAMHANFELMDKLGVELWCFHDRDIAPEGATLAESNENLARVVEVAEELQKGSHFRPLWGTAQLFKHKRYMHGAATSSNVSVFVHAAAQVKAAMEATIQLGGENYVFWGGREGYVTSLTSNTTHDALTHATLLRLATSHKRALRWSGTLLIEPKPREPTLHQYDYDVGSTVAFLHAHGLASDFKLNIECNHAQLAGHSCAHELRAAAAHNMLGGLDANTGDPHTGWDTDQFLTDPREATMVMLAVLEAGGLGSGGINFDAKLRRESTHANDVVYAHVAGMDALARGLRNAAAIIESGRIHAILRERYNSWWAADGLGKKILSGRVTMTELERLALRQGEPAGQLPSAQAELAEALLAMEL